MDPKAGGGGDEEDCVDSGAETGGSDYSHLSSTSSELSVEEAQDPFLVSIHIIADPGESQALQEAIDKVLAWIHPDLPLFRVSERRACRRRRKAPKGAQPALAVVLFLQEEYGEEQILQLHRTLQRPPWRHHHTERVQGRFLPYLPCSQDFFTLAPGTPLWAIRPVHYGKEIVRFTIYCSHDNYADSQRFYELILRRTPSQRKTDFCIFPVFSNLDVDIQFSLKRLPCDQSPVPTDSSVLEFRVRDIGELVPLLPNPCSPISEGRWQTEDHDGNKILLQCTRVRLVFGKQRKTCCLCGEAHDFLHEEAQKVTVVGKNKANIDLSFVLLHFILHTEDLDHLCAYVYVHYHKRCVRSCFFQDEDSPTTSHGHYSLFQILPSPKALISWLLLTCLALFIYHSLLPCSLGCFHIGLLSVPRM
ncbi:protein FAM124A isoform X2 [Microcebus murinus]|uniref:protein FAM124A isoform X2 n=1 Tax=Microcebus murinus TaxID=30608 RepID=UPI003F6B2DD8